MTRPRPSPTTPTAPAAPCANPLWTQERSLPRTSTGSSTRPRWSGPSRHSRNWTPAMTQTVIELVLRRLKTIGIEDIFGVPGDYAFSVQDAIVHDPHTSWVGCCNELNAAYAADCYARLRGLGRLSTTYGVGELSALNGMAGAHAKHLPVFHLVGMPTIAAQRSRALVHHTLGDGEFDLFRKMTEPVVCASATMTPQNVAYETERLIAAALYHRRPVYMAFPSDLANQPVVSSATPLGPPHSDPATLQSA